jgi:CDP-paratose 2-epimerase
MKLLITGGCGFLGSNLAAEALKQNSDLVILDALYRKGSDENLN